MKEHCYLVVIFKNKILNTHAEFINILLLQSDSLEGLTPRKYRKCCTLKPIGLGALQKGKMELETWNIEPMKA